MKYAFLGLLCGALSSAAAAAVDGGEHGEVPLSFIKTNCVDCHNDSTAEGKFRADRLGGDLGDAANQRAWSRVLARVQSGEMPPPAASDRPAEAEVEAALGGLKKAFYQAAQGERRHEGRVRVRRLNRREYENTVRDLLDIDTPLRDLLPADDLVDGFSNQADGLSISPVHIHQYMAAANRALAAATVRQERPETKTHRFSYTDEAEKPFHGHTHNRLACNLRGEDLHFFLDTHVEVPASLRQFERVTLETPGRYRLRIVTEARDTTDGEDLIFSVWLAAGNKRRELLGHFDAQHRKESVVELTRWFERGETIIVAPWRMEKVRHQAGYSIYLPDKQENIPKGWHWINNPNPPIPTVGPAIVVKPIEITGPLHDSWPPAGHQLLYGDESLNRFISRAFRRPADAEEVELYQAMVQDRLANGAGLEAALNAAHRAVLCAPDFLFLVERGPKLDSHELAARLSYFLWRTAPDARLRELADNDELTKPDVLRAEVTRLVAAPRFEAFVDDFLAEWLNLREIDATMPDSVLFPEYYSGGVQDMLLQNSLAGETRAYFRDLVEHDRGVTMLVSAGHTFLNQRLAEHYDLPAVKGAALRRVDLPADSVRGGLLTQASILKVTANGATTSPVLRGAWLLERIVGTPAPPPPPDAGSIEPDTRGATTIREQLAKHQSVATCAGCHQKIDPPGFVLECFDPIGRYREYYRTSETGEKLPDVKYLKGPAVDTLSELADGTIVADVRGYKAALSARPELLARGFVRKLVTFATGASVEVGDELVIDAILNRAQPSGYGLRTLIHEVVQSELFTSK
jgi:hypothetical protein